MLQKLKQAVCQANIELQTQQLVIYSWGNVSGLDREQGLMVIKPSGVAYDQLTPDKMVVLNLDGGEVREGDLSPSSDTPTHLELYRNFESLGGICHTHSPHAVMWAQACREIPCLGTTHADYFYGPIPVTENMTEDEIAQNYEANTGQVIVRRFQKLDPRQIPAVLVAGHGPFTWGASPARAVEASVVLEQVAAMALGSITINSGPTDISQTLLDKHFFRKHGPQAYYGQK